MTPVRTWAVLLITWGAAVLCIWMLILGAVILDGPTVAALIAVPTAQAIAMVGFRAWRRRTS